jgi:hypothetical protein
LEIICREGQNIQRIEVVAPKDEEEEEGGGEELCCNYLCLG